MATPEGVIRNRANGKRMTSHTANENAASLPEPAAFPRSSPLERRRSPPTIQHFLPPLPPAVDFFAMGLEAKERGPFDADPTAWAVFGAWLAAVFVVLAMAVVLGSMQIVQSTDTPGRAVHQFKISGSPISTGLAPRLEKAWYFSVSSLMT